MSHKILLLDDSAADREIIKATLAKYDCEFLEVDPLLEVPAIVKRQRPDLLILEPASTQIDGFRLSRKPSIWVEAGSRMRRSGRWRLTIAGTSSSGSTSRNSQSYFASVALIISRSAALSSSSRIL